MLFRFLRSDSFRLFLISFLLLFFELVCIRWLSAYVLYLGYFANFVLLGALLGIGAGVLQARRAYRLMKWLPPVVFGLVTVILFSRSQVNPDFEGFIYFTSSLAFLRLPAYILLPLIFAAVTAIFTLLSQELGGLLTRFVPLTAYTWNILGSLAGIGSFTLLSFLSTPAWVWFLLAALAVVPFLPPGRSFRLNRLLLVGLVVVIASSDYALRNIWSPYYRLNLIEVKGEQVQRVGAQRQGERGQHYVLLANGAGHQEFTAQAAHEAFYDLPYSAFDTPPVYRNALVIGAGGGNDVATALAAGVGHVDAVEIDPRIIELGRAYHPENPYADPRVSVYIDDARSFLQKTAAQYDLIIFALPDSLVLASNFGSVRLESYLFTREAFQSARERLAPAGLVVLYNYYRSDWLVEKIVGMLAQVFPEPPVYHLYSEPRYQSLVFATIFAGPKSAEIDAAQAGFTRAAAPTLLAPATDNWPFLYMKQPSLPPVYGGALALILLFSLVYLWRLAPPTAAAASGWPFFFMGAAFALLETKSIIQLLLLFGSTWLVNSLAFFGILLVVLMANGLAARYKFSRLWTLYLLLLVALTLNYFLPLHALLFDNLALRYGLAIAVLFSPIFCANLIYSTLFRDTNRADTAFGANLIGTMVGGTAEYLALYFGYQDLILVAAIFYLLAFYFLNRMRAQPVAG